MIKNHYNKQISRIHYITKKKKCYKDSLLSPSHFNLLDFLQIGCTVTAHWLVHSDQENCIYTTLFLLLMIKFYLTTLFTNIILLWVFVYELSGCGFESPCSHNFACLLYSRMLNLDRTYISRLFCFYSKWLLFCHKLLKNIPRYDL